MTSATNVESGCFVIPRTAGPRLRAAALAEGSEGERPRQLQGTWTGELGGRRVALELHGSGAYLLAGAAGRWRCAAGQLELDEEPFAYRLSGDWLLLRDRAGQVVSWDRQS